MRTLAKTQLKPAESLQDGNDHGTDVYHYESVYGTDNE